MPRSTIAIGDRVAYSAVWLRSTGTPTGDYPFLRGKVASLEELAPKFVLAVNVANLVLAKRIAIDAALADRIPVSR